MIRMAFPTASFGGAPGRHTQVEFENVARAKAGIIPVVWLHKRWRTRLLDAALPFLEFSSWAFFAVFCTYAAVEESRATCTALGSPITALAFF